MTPTTAPAGVVIDLTVVSTVVIDLRTAPTPDQIQAVRYAERCSHEAGPA